MIVTCSCGCDDGVHIIKVNPEYDGSIACLSYVSGNFYKKQENTFLGVFKNKLKNIWSIIRNKDYYYSDILMSKEDFQQLKDYINQFGE